MAQTGTAQIPAGVNNFYVRTMLKAARPLLVYTRWAQIQDIPRNNTNVIKFRRYSLLSAKTTALTEGTTPTGSQLSITNVTGTVKQYGDYVTLTDLVSFTTLDPLITETSDVQGEQAGNTLDQLTRNVLVAGTTVQYASTATSTDTISASMKITRDEVKEAVRTLQGNNAMKMTRMVNATDGFNTTPINAAYIGIISNSTLFDLKDEVGFIPVEEYASTRDVMDGEVGSLDDVRFVMTTNASTVAGSLTTVHRTMIIAKNFYGITRISGEAMQNIVKPIGSSGTADPLNQRGTQGWKATFVAMILNENFGLRLEHAVSS